MAGEQHGVNKGHFKVGAVVKCLDNLGHELQGEVVAVDGPSGTAYLRKAACSRKPNLFDYFLININFLTTSELIREPNLPEAPLPNYAFEKLNGRLASNIEDKMKKSDLVRPGSCATGQSLITTISKTIEHVRWSGDEILVMNSIAIKPPYLPENCQNLKENQQEALTLVRKLVEKFHRDLGLKQSAGTATTNQ